MLRVGRTAAVTEHQHLPALCQRRHDFRGRALDRLPTAGAHPLMQRDGVRERVGNASRSGKPILHDMALNSSSVTCIGCMAFGFI